LYGPIFLDEKAAIDFFKTIDFFRRTIECVCGAYMKQVKSTLLKEEFVFTVQMAATKGRALKQEHFFKNFVYLLSSN